MILYCDLCESKKCVSLSDRNCRLMFTRLGNLEGMKTERIEDCPYRDGTRMIEVNFRNREEVKSTEKGTAPTNG